MVVTIKEVAKEADVSTAVVSLVINEKHKGRVGKEKRKKVLAAVKKLNFFPSSFGRGLKLKKSRNIGYVYGLDNASDPYFQEMILAMENEVRKHGYSLLFFAIPNHNKEYQKFFDITMKTVQMDGLIIPSPSVNNKNIEELMASKLPMVFLGTYSYSKDATCIDVDNEKAGFIATEHIIGLGKKNICYLNIFGMGTERLTGYKRALETNGLKVRAGLIKDGFDSVQSGYDTFKKVVDGFGMPDGIVAHNDLMAMGAMKFVMEQKKFRIPEDVAIVGFNNTYISQYSAIPITVVDIPSSKFAIKAVEMLIDLLNGKKSGEKKMLMPDRLIVRESSVKK